MPGNWKDAVLYASTIEVDLNSTTSIDGTTLYDGDRVLLKDQTTLSKNGIYVYNHSASPRFTRATDASTYDLLQYAAVYVERGDANAGRTFLQINPLSDLETDPVRFIPLANPILTPAGITANNPDVTLDRKRIQATIDAVSAVGGGTVQLGLGTFYIDTKLDLKSNVALQGAGSDVTTLLFKDNSDYANGAFTYLNGI